MFTLKREAIHSAFNAAGFDDVEFDDAVIARRAGDAHWEVVLDKGGQLKIVVTQPAAQPDAKRVELAGRKASLLTETTRVSTLAYKLEDASELPAVLAAVEKLVR
jgi:hypothetical protein